MPTHLVSRARSVVLLIPLVACSSVGTSLGAAPDAGNPTVAALPVCASPASPTAAPALPTLLPHGAGPGWGDGPHVYSLVAPTATGWTLALVSGVTPATDSVDDDGNLLAGLAAGDRIAVDGIMHCQTASGCKEYAVVTNAADGSLIAASYDSDFGMDGFSTALGVAVSLEPVCRFTAPDGCYPGATVVQNQLRFGSDPARIGAGASGSVTIASRAVRVAAGRLTTLSGGGESMCLDGGSFWRGGQRFNLAR